MKKQNEKINFFFRLNYKTNVCNLKNTISNSKPVSCTKNLFKKKHHYSLNHHHRLKISKKWSLIQLPFLHFHHYQFVFCCYLVIIIISSIWIIIIIIWLFYSLSFHTGQCNNDDDRLVGHMLFEFCSPFCLLTIIFDESNFDQT